MKGFALLPAIGLLALGVVPASAFEPAWGGNCLSCHGLLQTGVIQVFGENTISDPDESATGAPDRGPLKVFRTYRGMVKSLTATVQSLVPDDMYAVEVKRLRFPGVVSGGQLAYGADCDWPEWGETPSYYTEPEIAHRWPAGPTTFSYDIEVEPTTAYDYYDLVFAVAGKFNDTASLFYNEEHFYLQVIPSLLGDLNCNGEFGFDDINPFVLRLSNGAQYAATYPNCPNANGDINSDGTVDFGDINPFVALLSGG
jgi:hypothetical protein